MKKFTAILLTVIMVASLFTSCSNSIAPNIDETVSVSFDEATSRSLTASLEDFVKGDYFWKYAAQKNASDGTGLNSGATEAYDEAHAKWVKGDTSSESNKGLGSVAGFSQGIWDFKLFAYKKVGTEAKLAYEGEVTGVSLKKGSANTVTVTVSPVAGATGTLILADTISLAPAKAGNTPTNLAKVYTVTELGGTAAISPTTGTNQWTLNAGAYKVNVDFVKDGFTYASGSVVATVYSNITTTVSGSLAELVTKAEFDSDINPDVMNKEASSDSVDLGTLTQTGASDVTLRESTSKVEATVPAAAASQIIKTVAGNDASNNTTIDLALRVDTVSATNTTLELEIGMQATVTQKDVTDKVINQTTQKVTELKDSEGTPVISVVTIKLQPGLQNVAVQHNGTDMVDLSVSTNGQGYSYYANTGILKIQTSSFSPFTVTYDVPDYVAKIGDKKYTSLESAFNAVQSGETIILLKNSAGNGIKVPSGSNFIVDFNNYTYDIDGTTVGSSGTETNGFQLLRDSNIEFRNGKITSTKAKILIQNYCNLTLRDITLDGSNLVGNYTLSNNFGNVTVTGNTQLIAKEGKCAFDVYYWPDNGYGNGVTVTFDENFTGKVSGRIEYGSDGTDTGKAYIAEKANLIIKAGTFEGSIFTYELSDSDATGITIEGGSFTDLASAIKYAADGANIKLASDIIINDTVNITKSIVLDGENRTITSGAYLPYKALINVKGEDLNVTIRNINMNYGPGCYNWYGIQLQCKGGKSVIDGVNIDAYERALYINGCSQIEIEVKGSTLVAIYPFNVNGGPIKSMKIEDSDLNGWTSFDRANETYVFTNCRFGKGYGYATVKPYGNTIFTGCTFSSDYFENLEGGIASGTTTPISIHFNDCFMITSEGSKADLTVELLRKAFNYDITSGSSSGDSTINKQYWYVNEEQIAFNTTEE